MPLFSRARLAGAASVERKPSLGFRASSQMGQVVQSELLENEWPFLQVLMRGGGMGNKN